MAAGRSLVTFDIEATVGWPTFDPQAGRSRAADVAPIAVTLDPRDEEHSLMLAIRRLAADPSLRRGLARAGHEWWATHATPAHAAAAWTSVLAEARGLVPPRGAGWPAHLSWDGSELARRICDEIGSSHE